MKVSKWILKAANGLLSAVVSLCLLVAGAYAVYALWDNAQVYAAVENVQFDMLQRKPVVPETGEEGPTFEELLKINGDVCAWLTLDGTEIDYPVLQGENNLSYINTDVYGNFALAGSIFLDSSCSRSFQDSYHLLYGHHMEGGKMFGDLDRYKDQTFFQEHTTGTLILPDRSYTLRVFACLVEPASEPAIFSPWQWKEDVSGLVDFVDENALLVRQETVDQIRASEEHPQVLAMSTCASEFTDARTILLALMEPHSPER